MPVDGLIERQFVGYEAKLGEFYDAREDRFCSGSLLKSSFSLNSAQQTIIASEDIQIALDEPIASKMFGISPELKLSLQVGMLDTAHLIGQVKNYAHAAKGDIVMRKQIMESKINIFDESIEDSISFEQLRRTHATHYVCRVVFGSNTTVTFQCTNVDPLKERKNKKWLEHKMKKIVDKLLGKPFSAIRITDTLEEYSFKVYVNGSKEAASSLLTFDDVYEFLLDIRKNPKDVNPISYDLFPIDNVLSHFGIENTFDRSFQEFCCISDRAKELENLLDELEKVKLKLANLKETVQSVASVCIEPSKISKIMELQKEFLIAEKEFLMIIKQAIVSVRCKITSPKEVDEILDTFNNCSFSPSSVQRFLNDHEFIPRKIMWYECLQKDGVDYFFSEEDFLAVAVKEADAYAFCCGDFSAAEMSEKWAQENAQFHSILMNEFKSASFSVVESPSYGNNSSIMHYKKGRLICSHIGNDDLIIPTESTQANAKRCLVRYMTCNEPGPKPSKRGFLAITCPGVMFGFCALEVNRWYCQNCNIEVEYGYDGYLYCQCGRFQAKSTGFKCTDAKHIVGYMQFPSDDDLSKMLDSITPRREINILILGETGVGKSTFINSFANYITHGSLQEAENSELISLISTSFVVTNDDYEETKIEFGPKDGNEVDNIGMSRTQSSRAYVFSHRGDLIRLIDTPGLGDDRGIEQDRKHFEDIRIAASEYPIINGICILLKPNNARLSVLFSFCIKELLCHLHKSVRDNILFVFTNSRSTFYKPGDTLPALREILKDIKSREPFVELPLDKRTIFCIDNEAFRFLVALKNEITFCASDKENFSVSWMKSAQEYNRLMHRITNMIPHQVSETVLLNETRNSHARVGEIEETI